VDASPVELRVLGCLIEKQRTTPDQYPLSLNALRLACNQSTNRDPVVEYDEATVSEALRRLALRGWTRLASGAGSRARKYRHLLSEALDVDDAELSLLAVLMLRGPQTPGELKQRTERMLGFESLAAVQETLDRLVERELVARHERRPGQKELRYEQLLGGSEDSGAGAVMASDSAAEAAADSPASPAVGQAPSATASGESRLDRLEREMTELRAELAELRQALGD
jgi:uncharacterized protein YceH (UPF0502 family)